MPDAVDAFAEMERSPAIAVSLSEATGRELAEVVTEHWLYAAAIGVVSAEEQTLLAANTSAQISLHYE